MLYIVGTGPGDPEYITLKALKTLEKCRVVAGWPSVLQRMPIEGKEVVTLSYSNQEAQLRQLAELSREVDVCLVVHGDPAVSEWELLQRVRQLTHFEVVSGVSSVNIALAKAGLDLAQVVVVSQHARTPQQLPNCGRGLVIIPPPTLEQVQNLIESLKSRGCRGWLMEDLTLPTERTTSIDVAMPTSSLAIIVAVCPGEDGPAPRYGQNPGQ